MPSMTSSQANAPSLPRERSGVPGSRVVLALFGAGVVMLAVMLTLTLVFVADEGDIAETCREQAGVCSAVASYVDALNAHDALALEAVLTERGMQSTLRAASGPELEQRLAGLTADDRIQELRITSVRVSGDSAITTIRYSWRDQDLEAAYRLVRVDGSWRIDWTGA